MRCLSATVASLLLLGGIVTSSATAPTVPATKEFRNAAALRGLDGGSPLYAEPPPPLPTPLAQVTDPAAGTPDTPGRTFGIPTTVLDAYHRAADVLAGAEPACHLDWPVLAGIGEVESGQAEAGAVDARGEARQPILGPVLDGSGGVAAIANSVTGRWDQTGRWARAIGPMQFLPSSWSVWGADGNGDGAADPENIYDASLAAGRYLCAGGRDLATADGLRSAILSYNHSQRYLDIVLLWIEDYRHGGYAATDLPSTVYWETASRIGSMPAQAATPASAPVARAAPSAGSPAAKPRTADTPSPSAPPSGAGASPPPKGGSLTAPLTTLVTDLLPGLLPGT